MLCGLSPHESRVVFSVFVRCQKKISCHLDKRENDDSSAGYIHIRVQCSVHKRFGYWCVAGLFTWAVFAADFFSAAAMAANNK